MKPGMMVLQTGDLSVIAQTLLSREELYPNLKAAPCVPWDLSVACLVPKMTLAVSELWHLVYLGESIRRNGVAYQVWGCFCSVFFPFNLSEALTSPSIVPDMFLIVI